MNSIFSNVPRFYVERIPPVSQQAAVFIMGNEAHHLLHVLRLKVGRKVSLFDGSGIECLGTIIETSRHSAKVQIAEWCEADIDPVLDLTLATAVPRAQRMDFLVEKCCELGVRRLIPLRFERSVINPLQRVENHMRHWKLISVSASKQSGRSRLTEIISPMNFSDLLRETANLPARLLLSPGEEATPLATLLPGVRAAGRVLAVVGPEGGLSEGERAAAIEAGLQPASLGPMILRVETAAIVCAALVLETT